MVDDALEKSLDETDRLSAETRLVEDRRAKLDLLRSAGNAFPNDFCRVHFSSNLHSEYGGHSNDSLEAEPIAVSVAGRLILKRVMGKASFATLQDMNGRIQLYIANASAGAAGHDAFKHYAPGAIRGAAGTPFKTR